MFIWWQQKDCIPIRVASLETRNYSGWTKLFKLFSFPLFHLFSLLFKGSCPFLEKPSDTCRWMSTGTFPLSTVLYIQNVPKDWSSTSLWFWEGLWFFGSHNLEGIKWQSFFLFQSLSSYSWERILKTTKQQFHQENIFDFLIYNFISTNKNEVKVLFLRSYGSK